MSANVPASRGMIGVFPPLQGRLRAGSLVLTAQFLAFLLVSAGGFLPRNASMFTSFDGYYMRVIVRELFHFSNYVPGMPIMHFQGMGTPFGLNPLLLPSMLPFALFGETPGAGLGYIACPGLMFLSTYTLGRALGFARPPSLLAAWLLLFLTFTMPPWLTVNAIYNLAPQAADTNSVTMFGLALLARGYASRRSGWAALGLVLAVIWLFVATPLSIVLLLPTVIPLALGIMARYARTPGFLRKSGVLLRPVLGFVALGGGVYLWGFHRDTAATFFTQELGIRHAASWNETSILFARAVFVPPFHFDGPFHISSPVSGLLIGPTLVGLALSVWKTARPLRFTALSVLAAIAAYALYIAIYASSNGPWIWPHPAYFEFALWPLYALFASYVVVESATATIGLLAHLRARASTWMPRLKPARLMALHAAAGALLGLLILDLRVPAGATLLRFVMTAHPPAPSGPPTNYDWPAVDTVITTGLGEAAGIAPGRPFRDYVVNLTGTRETWPGTIYWINVLERGVAAFAAFGNPHLMPFLWSHGVPTLEAYSQFVEPPLYAVARRLLSRPSDGQLRNIATVTRPELPLLQSLGVRFLISEDMLSAPAKSSIALRAPDLDQYVFGCRIPITAPTLQPPSWSRPMPPRPQGGWLIRTSTSARPWSWTKPIPPPCSLPRAALPPWSAADGASRRKVRVYRCC